MSSDTKIRMTILETILGVPVEGEQLSVCDKMDALSAETSVIRNELSEQRDVVLIRIEELAAVIDAQNSVGGTYWIGLRLNLSKILWENYGIN
nr:hypothetical protein CFP56_67304 [Quercus suber]